MATDAVDDIAARTITTLWTSPKPLHGQPRHMMDNHAAARLGKANPLSLAGTRKNQIKFFISFAQVPESLATLGNPSPGDCDFLTDSGQLKSRSLKGLCLSKLRALSRPQVTPNFCKFSDL